MINSRALQRENSSKKLLESALNEFAGNGYSQTKLSDISDKAGVAYGLISQRFLSKENLYFTVIEQAFSDVFGRLSHANNFYAAIYFLSYVLKTGMVEEKPSFMLLKRAICEKDGPEGTQELIEKLIKETGVLKLLEEGAEGDQIIYGEPMDVLFYYIRTAIGLIECSKKDPNHLPGDMDIVSIILKNKTNYLVEKCIKLFSKESEVDVAIDKLLEMILQYYGADKTYFVDLDIEKLVNSKFYEKRKAGITDGVKEFADSSEDVLKAWYEEISRKPEVYISDTKSSEEYDNPLLRETFERGKIDSLMVSSYKEGGRPGGFMGVDNARINQTDMSLLRTVTAIIRSELNRKYKAIAKDSEAASVIAGLAGNFEDIVYVEYADDPKDDATHCFRVSEDIANFIGPWRETFNVRDRLYYLSECLVHPEDKEEFLRATKRKVVTEGMLQSTAYIVPFRAIIWGEVRNYQMRFVPIDKDNTKIRGYVCGINNVDKELNLERAQEQERRRVSDIIRALSQDYKRVFYVDPKTDDITEVRADSALIVEASDVKYPHYKEALEEHLLDYVMENDIVEFRKDLSLKNIKKVLKKNNTYSRIFLSKSNKYYEIKVAKTGEDSENYVFGIAERDAQIRGAREQEDTIHEAIDILCEEEDSVTAINSLLMIAIEYYDAARIGVYEFTRDGDKAYRTYEHVAAWADGGFLGPNGVLTEDHKSIVSKLKSTNEVITFSPDFIDETEIGQDEYKVKNSIVIPLKVEDELLGMLAIANCNKSTEDTFTFKIISAFVLNEILRHKQTAEENRVLNEIAGSFLFVGFMDFEINEMHLHRAKVDDSVKTPLESSYESLIEFWLNRNIIPEDIPRFKIMSSPAYVMEQFKSRDNVEFGFQCDVSGQRRNYEMKFIRANQEGTKAIISLEDNTELIKHESEVRAALNEAKNQAETASRAKSEFLSRMSHDIRTPINGIIGMTGIAKRNSKDPKKVEDCLDKIDTASNHLMNLLNDVLDLSKIESGKLVIAKGPMNLIEFANKCYSITLGQLDGRNIEFERDYDKLSAPDVIGDELHLRQAVLNVLGNAVKFTPDGGKITFTIKETSFDGEHMGIRITVTDSGKGIKEEFLEHIWDPFSQEEYGTRTNYKGSGLGMPITKHLVEEMGGSISVESVIDEGSTFFIDMTLDVQHEISPVKKTHGTVRLKGANILLAEDNEINVEVASEILKSRGAFVTVAENGRVAFDKFFASEVGEFDLILMDIMMPITNGLECTREIRSLGRPDAKTIPIIAMTANAFDEDIKKSREAGMNAHLSKPIQVSTMLKTIAYFLEERRKKDGLSTDKK